MPCFSRLGGARGARSPGDLETLKTLATGRRTPGYHAATGVRGLRLQ
jgi:hypothetical protein